MYKQGVLSQEEKKNVMQKAAEQLSSGGKPLTSCGKKMGDINWDIISKAMNRSVVQCKNTYKDEQRRLIKMTNIKGAYTAEEVKNHSVMAICCVHCGLL